MTKNINQAHILGKLTKDPEMRRVGAKQTELMTMSVVTETRWKDKVTNEWKGRPTFHNIQSWDRDVIQIAERLSKGMEVELKGNIETRKYEDKQGVTKYATSINIGIDGMLRAVEDGDMPKPASRPRQPDELNDEVPF